MDYKLDLVLECLVSNYIPFISKPDSTNTHPPVTAFITSGYVGSPTSASRYR